MRVALTVFAEPVTADPPVPVGRVPADALLPAMYAVDDAAIAAAVRAAEARGKSVSCRNGCSACCRGIPVPVTPPEALALLRLVESLPGPRRSEVTARFAEAVTRLEAAGLADVFRRVAPVCGPAEARAAAEAYFRLRLACPFLDGDSCSIHPSRPFVCRQYLVTSPAEWCDDPFARRADVVPLPVTPAKALQAAAGDALGRPLLTVPLVLALEHAAANRAALEEPVDGETVFRAWAAGLE